MRKFAHLTTAALLAVSLGFAGPAQAATSNSANPSTTNPANPDLVSSLIVKYRNGVQIDLPGNGVAGFESLPQSVDDERALGRGFHTIQLSQPISKAAAAELLNQIQADSRIEVAAINLENQLQPTSLGANKFIPASQSKPVTRFFSPLAAVKKSTAPQSVLLEDNWQSADPKRAQLKLTWKAPKKLNGGSLWGYKLEYSTDGSTYKVLSANTKKKTTSLLITTGLTVGQQRLYRVSAVTKYKTKTYVSSPATSNAAAPSITPAAPVMNGPRHVDTLHPTISWVNQATPQRGGLAVTYAAVAQAPSEDTLTCETTADSCTFSGLTPGVHYEVGLKVSNARGTTWAPDELVVNDELFNLQWYDTEYYGINAEQAWPLSVGNSSVVVAVLDSGLADHPDIQAAVVKKNDGSWAGYDFVSSLASAADGDGWDADAHDPGDWIPEFYDSNDPTTFSSWHGTHVAGLISSQANNIGVVGVAPGVKLLPVRVLGNNGGSVDDLIAALNWAAGVHVAGVPDNANPAKVINMSMGTGTWTSCNVAVANTITAIKAMGVTMVTAAGNSGTDAASSYPGNCRGTINVGATAFDGSRTSYSNWGNFVDISAPGGDVNNPGDSPAQTLGQIISLINTGQTVPSDPGYAVEEGTSMSAPLVSGVIALMYSVEPTITPDQVWQILKTTANPFPAGSNCAIAQVKKCGAGILNAGAAVYQASLLK